jgi:hypothetical protein
VIAPLLGVPPERKSARTSSRREPIGHGRQVQLHQGVRGFQEPQVLIWVVVALQDVDKALI